MQVIINRCDESRTNTLIATLDEQSKLKNGKVILSFLELDQLLDFCPNGTEEEKHLKDTMIQSFAHIVHQIYKGDMWDKDYLDDQELAYNLIVSMTYQ